MEGLNVVNNIENIESVDKNMEAARRVVEAFNQYEITPEKIKNHGVLAERI